MEDRRKKGPDYGYSRTPPPTFNGPAPRHPSAVPLRELPVQAEKAARHAARYDEGMHIPVVAGAPSDTPDPIRDDLTPIRYDATNKKLWVWDEATTTWVGVTVA